MKDLIIFVFIKKNNLNYVFIIKKVWRRDVIYIFEEMLGVRDSYEVFSCFCRYLVCFVL